MKGKESEYVLLLPAILLSIAAIILFSVNTSFLYRDCYLELNGSDAIRNMVAAKHWVKNGLLPYKDLYTTSGLSVYICMAAGYLIMGEAGVLLIQILCFTISLVIVDRILCKEGILLKLSGMIFFLFVSLAGYSTGAASLEFTNPLLLYSIWYITEEIGSSEKKALSYRDCIMAFVAVALIFTNVFLGISAISAIALRGNFDKKRNMWVLFFAILTVTTLLLGGAGMLKPWAKMFAEYYIPILKEQLYPNALLLHRIVKMIPSCLILLAAFFTGSKSKRLYYIITWIMVALYLITGEEAWFRYGILAPYLPVCLREVANGTRQKNIYAQKLAFLCFLSLAVYLVPLKYMIQNYYSEVVKENYKEEADGVSSWNDEEYSEGMLCLDTSAKYYLLLDKVPVNRYYTRQSTLSAFNETIAEYMYDYLWNNEYKGDIFLYRSSSGWVPESINHYKWISICYFSEYIALYEWSDEIPEDVHEHETEASEMNGTDELSEWEGL